MHDRQLKPAVDRCMKYGLEGIVKLDAIQPLLPNNHPLVAHESDDTTSRTIKKGRKWRDISKDGNSSE